MTQNPTGLRLLRRLRNLPLDRVAADLSIHKSTLSSIERGLQSPAKKLRARIATYYGVKKFDALAKPTNATALADAIVKQLNRSKNV